VQTLPELPVEESVLSDQLHAMAPHHTPFYITGPGETDVLMVGTGLFLIGAILAVGVFYWYLHSLPERMAHKTQKLQFEVVAVLGLISLFTHEHIYWIAGLILALIDLPDFSTPLRSIAGSVERIAGGPSPAEDDALSSLAPVGAAQPAQAAKIEVPSHA
jgi:hypothetical protein